MKKFFALILSAMILLVGCSQTASESAGTSSDDTPSIRGVVNRKIGESVSVDDISITVKSTSTAKTSGENIDYTIHVTIANKSNIDFTVAPNTLFYLETKNYGTFVDSSGNAGKISTWEIPANKSMDVQVVYHIPSDSSGKKLSVMPNIYIGRQNKTFGDETYVYSLN